MNDIKESSSDRITEEAADWFSRIREEELSRADRERFAQWLAESPVHIREYLGISETWGALQAAQHWPEQTSEQLFETLRVAQAGNIVPLKRQRAGVAHHPPVEGKKRRRLFAIA